MIDGHARRDRTARLVRVANLLRQHPHGLTLEVIAERTGVSPRTARRDLMALESTVGTPIWHADGRWGVLDDGFLAPLRLTLLEAIGLYLSARLLARASDRHEPHISAAFEKLAAVLPSPLVEHVHATVAALAVRPRDLHQSEVFEVLSEAWANGRRVRIRYAKLGHPEGEPPSERLFDPYTLEPNPNGHGLYVVGHDHLSGGLRTFKLERIQHVDPTPEHFLVPPSFDLAERLRNAWIITDDHPFEVRLRFHDASAIQRLRESRWHDSQRLETQPDGSVIVSFVVGGLLEIRQWVLTWGHAVEVLEPPELRQEIVDTTRAMLARYGQDAALPG
ncbi:MAG: transcriptional regulator [Chloroflexi bacterium]|nr:transcriptional regulator [Chloroflexota bacterium]